MIDYNWIAAVLKLYDDIAVSVASTAWSWRLLFFHFFEDYIYLHTFTLWMGKPYE